MSSYHKPATAQGTSYARGSDLHRLMRAVKVIARLAWKYRTEDIAAALMKHCSSRERGDAAFVGTFLDDVWQLNKEAERELEPRCCECGRDILGTKDTGPRADARYCSPKCRQHAYRRRVTHRTSLAESEPSRGDGLSRAGDTLAVTPPSAPANDIWPDLPACLRRAP
jgi:hypothetical protein